MEKLQESQQEKVAGKETYTSRLSRRIDAAYDASKAGKDGSDELLYGAFLAQANNVVEYRLRTDAYDPTLGRDIARRAMMALKDFRGESKPSTWFYSIAQNEVNRALSEYIEARETSVPLDRLYQAGSNEDAGDQLALRGQAGHLDWTSQNAQNAKLDIGKLVRDLPPKQAKLISLYAEGYSLEEIARQTGEPLGTIRSRYRLAKMKARAKKNFRG